MIRGAASARPLFCISPLFSRPVEREELFSGDWTIGAGRAPDELRPCPFGNSPTESPLTDCSVGLPQIDGHRAGGWPDFSKYVPKCLHGATIGETICLGKTRQRKTCLETFYNSAFQGCKADGARAPHLSTGTNSCVVSFPPEPWRE